MITHNIVPNISVDCVIFGFDFEKLNVLLVERKLVDEQSGETLINDLTLAGYHIFEDENLEEAAARILKDVTGLENIYLEQFYTFGDLERVTHPNDQLWIKHINQGFTNQVITVGYFSLIDNTKVSLSRKEKKFDWYPVDSISRLSFAFDHRHILHKALESLRRKIKFEPVVFELLPEKFTLTQLQRVYEAIMGTELDKRNFRKKIAQMAYIIPLNEKQKGVSHKPAQLFSFSSEVYEKTHKGEYDFMF